MIPTYEESCIAKQPNGKHDQNQVGVESLQFAKDRRLYQKKAKNERETREY